MCAAVAKLQNRFCQIYHFQYAQIHRYHCENADASVAIELPNRVQSEKRDRKEEENKNVTILKIDGSQPAWHRYQGDEQAANRTTATVILIQTKKQFDLLIYLLRRIKL